MTGTSHLCPALSRLSRHQDKPSLSGSVPFVSMWRNTLRLNGENGDHALSHVVSIVGSGDCGAGQEQDTLPL